MKKQNEIAYFKQNEKYLILPLNGKSLIVDSEEDFKKYVKENNCKIIKH